VQLSGFFAASSLSLFSQSHDAALSVLLLKAFALFNALAAFLSFFILLFFYAFRTLRCLPGIKPLSFHTGKLQDFPDGSPVYAREGHI
jgi:hypothetical protein